MTLEVRCPAKINTFLSVGPPDASGYHPIRTVFQAIGLFDVLRISDESDTHRVTSDWLGMPANNTVSKTLRLLDELIPHLPLHVHVCKAIPAQSGLGGGSSDAAGLLRAVSRFVQAPLPEASLFDIALAVGADVPFFLTGGLARAEGYGEQLTPLPDAPIRWVVIAKPDAGVSTATAYAKLDAAPEPWRAFPGRESAVHNDFERVAPPESLRLIAALRGAGALGATLCGSGSAAFGLFETRDAAEAALWQVARHAAFACVTHTLTREESLRISSS